MGIEWGDLATWVSGLATSGGLIFAGLQIRDARIERKAEEARRIEGETERRTALARAVAVSSVADQRGDGWVIKYTIVNGGDYPIDEVVFVVADTTPETDPAEQLNTAGEIVFGTMYQKQIIKGEIEVSLSSAPVIANVTRLGSLLFTDTWGTSWWRQPGELVHRPGMARVC